MFSLFAFLTLVKGVVGPFLVVFSNARSMQRDLNYLIELLPIDFPSGKVF